MIKVKVDNLFRTDAQASGVVLKEVEGDRMLPIIIGDFEARVIAMSLENYQTSRPLTFDLFINIIESLNAEPEKVIISDIKDNTYYAILQLRFRSKPTQINARPSDALALAVRHNIPIFVEKSIMKTNRLDINKLQLMNGDKSKKNNAKEETDEMLEILSSSAFRSELKCPPSAKLTTVTVEGIFETDSEEKGVLLQEKDRDRKLPIKIGDYEANVIAMGIENVIPPRPLTHDLIANTIEDLGANIQRVIIDDFSEPDMFYSIIQLYRQPRKFEIDARPSDAVALALKVGAPILVKKRLMING